MQKLVQLKDVAAVLDVNDTSFRIFFNTMAPNIQSHKIPREGAGKRKLAYEYGDMCTLMRACVPRWNALHEEALYRRIQNA